jgi:molecular chaperone HtpG
LLTIPNDEPSLKGFRCFLAISDRVREENGDFFLQPHSTSIVWCGQKVLFVFQHHSNRFGLYYEVQTPDLLAYAAGGGPYATCTIVIKNRTLIPIPAEIEGSFIPRESETKRLEVKANLLYTDSSL